MAFTALDRMTSHWDRPSRRPGQTAYYWYLSFRNQHEVQALAARCHAAIEAPYFDLVAFTDLHMTIERVAFADEIDTDSRRRVEEGVSIALRGFAPLRFEVGPLAGSSGALSFSAAPKNRLNELRSRILTATHSAGFATHVSVADPFRPHVGIGYCNRAVDAAPIIKQVRELRALRPVEVCINELTLVALTRHERAYSWEIASRLPLTDGA